MKKVLCWIIGHNWFYKNKQLWNAAYWHRKCKRCGKVEICQRSGNVNLYSESQAHYLPFRTIEEQNSYYKLRDKITADL